MDALTLDLSEAPDQPWHRLPSRLPSACGFVRWGTGGALEVELYDYSDTAHDALGGDVALIYAVNGPDLPTLSQMLASRTGAAVAVEALPATLSNSFAHVEALIAWLKDSTVPITAQPDLAV